MSTNFATDLPEQIISDYERIRQILNNLIENAIKFTDKGTIEICLEQDASSTNHQLHFTVKDTGIGIPKDKTHRLFQFFSQVDSGLSRKYNGTGLGLAICKKIANLLGGTIWVESEPGEGSNFHFVIQYQEFK